MDDIFLSYKNITIFIHNLEFDGRIFIENIDYNKYKIKIKIKNKNIYSIIISFKNNNILFKCSYKIIPLSLKKIAISFNIGNKLIYPYDFINKNTLLHEGDIDLKSSNLSLIEYNEFYSIYEKMKSIKKYTILYCENDVILTKKLIENVNTMLYKYNINLINNKILSLSGLSLYIFSKLYNNLNLNLKYKDNQDKLIRKSYYGGRCEVFGNANDGEYVYHFDFPGMYSLCMKEKFPYGKYEIKYDINNIDEVGFYYIKFKSDMKIPILPHHNKSNFKLLFCNGELEGLYWFEEIQLFIKYGGKILSIEYGIIYEKYDECFKNYINEFEIMRSLGGEYKIMSKLITNSLYGRLAMQKKNEKTELIKCDDYINFIKKYKIISASFYSKYALVTYEWNNNESMISNISIASAITSKARIKLYNAYMDVIENGGRILYSDTDSIFASYNKPVINEKHGSVFWDSKKNDTIINDSIFIAPKHYGVTINNKDIIKIKGLNTKNITLSNLKHNFINNIDYIKKIKIFKKNINIEQKEIIKIIKMNQYDKRIWINKFKETIPLTYLNGEYF